jgi:NAD(P)H-hydrate epimerase
MNALSRAKVRAIDQHAIAKLGIPGAVLMENAGRGAASILEALGIRGPVIIACGKGNNGGDGLVIARLLTLAGYHVTPYLFARPDQLSGDAALQWHTISKMEIPVQIWDDQSCHEVALKAQFARADWIVDALFGTGLTGPVRSPLDRVIEDINASAARILAIDLPSGLDCDTGEPLGVTVRAEHTVTFVAPKLGFQNPGSLPYTGRVHVVDIGVGEA